MAVPKRKKVEVQDPDAPAREEGGHPDGFTLSAVRRGAGVAQGMPFLRLLPRRQVLTVQAE